MASHTGSESDDGMDSTSEHAGTESASEYSSECISEGDSMENVMKQKSIVPLSLRKRSRAHVQTETSRHKAWIEYVEDIMGPSLEFEPDHVVTTKTPRTSDTNKRARGIEDNDSHRRKAKIARHEGPTDMINTPSMSTEIESPRAPVAHDRGTTDMTANVQITNHTAATIPVSDQYSNNDGTETITSDIARVPRVDSENTLQIPTSCIQVSSQAHIEASTAGDQSSTQSMEELALNAHTAAAPLDHQRSANSIPLGTIFTRFYSYFSV